MQQPIDQPESPYEQLRRAQNAVSFGTITEVRTKAPARCRVKVGDVVTDWVPWLTIRAAGAKQAGFWWPPEAGEQVVLLAPGGDMRQAIALTSVFSDAMPEPESGGRGAMLMRWAESDYLEYKVGVLRINMLDCFMEFTSNGIRAGVPGATLEFDKDGLRVTPEVAVGAIKLTEHKHVGVIPGPALTGVPAP